MIDLKDIDELEFEGIDLSDCPDYVDAFIVSGWHKKENRALTDDELDWVNDQSDFVYERAVQHIQ